MRFIVFGAGAVGAVVGARLFQNGHDVVLIARGQHYRALRTDGLTLDSPEGSTTLRVPVVDQPDAVELGDGDVVLLGMKSQDTDAALRTLSTVAPPETPVVSLQNGVRNEPAILRLFARTYGICVMCPAGHLAPGVVEAHSAPVTGILDIGRFPHGVDDVCQSVADAFESSTFVSQPRADVMRWKYTKLLANLGNAVQAVCGPDAAAEPLVEMLRQEGTACLRAARIDFASQEEDRVRRGDLVPLGRADARRRGGSSWQSLERGTGSIETDYLNGEIVLLGRLHGIPTPANELLQRLADQLARDGARPGSVPVDEILGRLHAHSGPA